MPGSRDFYPPAVEPRRRLAKKEGHRRQAHTRRCLHSARSPNRCRTGDGLAKYISHRDLRNKPLDWASFSRLYSSFAALRPRNFTSSILLVECRQSDQVQADCVIAGVAGVNSPSHNQSTWLAPNGVGKRAPGAGADCSGESLTWIGRGVRYSWISWAAGPRGQPACFPGSQSQIRAALREADRQGQRSRGSARAVPRLQTAGVTPGWIGPRGRPTIGPQVERPAPQARVAATKRARVSLGAGRLKGGCSQYWLPHSQPAGAREKVRSRADHRKRWSAPRSNRRGAQRNVGIAIQCSNSGSQKSPATRSPALRAGADPARMAT